MGAMKKMERGKREVEGRWGDCSLHEEHGDHGATQRVLERPYSRIWTWVRWFRRAPGSRTFPMDWMLSRAGAIL